LAGINIEALDQRPACRIDLRIYGLVWMAVAAQKAVEPEHVAVPGAANDHRPRAGLEQANAPQDEGAHDALPEFRFRHQQRTQPVGRNDHRLHRLQCLGVDQGRPACELREFAHEGAWKMGDDRLAVAHAVSPADGDLAGQNDGQAAADFTDLGQRLPCTVAAELAKPAHALDLRRLERREHLVAAPVDDRLLRPRHGFRPPTN
jgi:hypothetical protein